MCLHLDSTHLTQPLDVSVFRGVKAEWRKILGQRKENVSNATLGFRACGIVPPDVQALLKRISGALDRPQDKAVTPGDSLLKQLESKRAEWIEKKKGGKRKKMNVPLGKSVLSEDVVSAGPSTNVTPSSSSGQCFSKQTTMTKKRRSKVPLKMNPRMMPI
ncbi:hypothetical protein GE061_014167 [Apolygus lucorum]|uniref:Uncharacterized protein n=1 Tax=Apolygus lucorum TaxID=248454 RepID=A0A8S9XR05_APOLU|nr:hypothetical protein GE061_014167 [Apolygus lucorum]